MVLKVEAGKFYRTRDGNKVGPMTYYAGGADYSRWRAPSPNNHYRGEWYENGSFYNERENSHGMDLIEEWRDSPVRTVTRKEIVPGTYGIVNVAVAPGYAATWIENRFYSPAEMRAAAATLIEIADALGDTK